MRVPLHPPVDHVKNSSVWALQVLHGGWRRAWSILTRKCQVYTDRVHLAIFTVITVVYWCLGASQTGTDTCIPPPETGISRPWGYGPGRGMVEDPQVIQMSLGATVGCCSLLVGVWGKEGKGREKPWALSCLRHLLSVHFNSEPVCINHLTPCESIGLSWWARLGPLEIELWIDFDL